MGRHGGGSRSGGSSRSSSRSSGGSRSGGSSSRVSKTPFKGCYNRSYINRRGVLVNYYTSDKNFGTKSGWNIGLVFALIFITIHMLAMVGTTVLSAISFGEKVSGDRDRIKIEDNANLLTEQEESEVIELFNEVYEESGMPVTLVTDDLEWKDYYSNIQVYSEELYYEMGWDEDAMIILFTAGYEGEFFDWEYDMYCGDDTVKCLSDSLFDKLLEEFHKGMAGQNLADALEHGWNSIIDDLAETDVNLGGLIGAVFCLPIYSIFYIAIFGSVGKSNEAYKYFKKNPDKLESRPMTIYSVCPSCGAANNDGLDNCLYCGTLLKITDGDITYKR